MTGASRVAAGPLSGHQFTVTTAEADRFWAWVDLLDPSPANARAWRIAIETAAHLNLSLARALRVVEETP